MRLWIECFTHFSEIIWAISRFSTYALMPAPYCAGPEKVAGNGARGALASTGREVRAKPARLLRRGTTGTRGKPAPRLNVKRLRRSFC